MPRTVFPSLTLLVISIASLIGGGQRAHVPLRVLAVGAVAGWQHESVSDALVAVYQLGKETRLWETTIRTDAELLTFRDLPRNGKNLDNFDAVFFYTSGELPMTLEQKEALLAFVRDKGKAFLGAHSATDTFYEWPAFGEMIGGYFDGHPWNQFEAELVVEEPDFPAMQRLPVRFSLTDEIYQIRGFSRERSRLLMRLDTSTVDLNRPGVKHHEIPVAWAHGFGRGRVFYCSLGHRPEVWRDARIRRMWADAFIWAMRR